MLKSIYTNICWVQVVVSRSVMLCYFQEYDPFCWMYTQSGKCYVLKLGIKYMTTIVITVYVYAIIPLYLSNILQWSLDTDILMAKMHIKKKKRGFYAYYYVITVRWHPDTVSRGGLKEEGGLCMNQYTIAVHINNIISIWGFVSGSVHAQ